MQGHGQPTDARTLPVMQKGRYLARVACTQQDVDAALHLRAECFKIARDGDSFDAQCEHILIEERTTKSMVGCFRLGQFTGQTLKTSYSSQHYDLRNLARFDGTMLELGRFCTRPDLRDPDILRLAWARLTQIVDQRQVKMLFGCTSFPGTEVVPFAGVFGLLNTRHRAPETWAPQVKAPEIYRFSAAAPMPQRHENPHMNIPPLLRTYLAMGGWVSDHAVVDRAMNTLHVFTGLEIAAIPEARKKLLRAIVQG